MTEAPSDRVIAILDEVSSRLTEALTLLRAPSPLDDAARVEAGVLRILARIHELRRHLSGEVIDRDAS